MSLTSIPYQRNIFQEIKEKVNIVDVVNRYWIIILANLSGQQVGLCPFYEDRKPYFYLPYQCNTLQHDKENALVISIDSGGVS